MLKGMYELTKVIVKRLQCYIIGLIAIAYMSLCLPVTQPALAAPAIDFDRIVGENSSEIKETTERLYQRLYEEGEEFCEQEEIVDLPEGEWFNIPQNIYKYGVIYQVQDSLTSIASYKENPSETAKWSGLVIEEGNNYMYELMGTIQGQIIQGQLIATAEEKAVFCPNLSR